MPPTHKSGNSKCKDDSCAANSEINHRRSEEKGLCRKKKEKTPDMMKTLGES